MTENNLMRRYRQTSAAFANQFDRPTPQDTEVVERGSILPFGTYANGMTGLAWPGLIADAGNALMAPSRAYEGEFGNYEDDPQRFIREGMNFAGTAAVGGSVVPHPQGALVSNSVRAAEHDPAAAINSLTRATRGEAPQAMEMPIYRGSQSHEAMPDHSRPYWATPDKGLAGRYAGTHDPKQFDVPYADLAPHEQDWFNQMTASRGNVTPGVARFENPLVVDAQGQGWSGIPFEGKTLSTDTLATTARERGHDGLVVNRVDELGDYPSTSVAALKPGTVRSPLTGEVLYANSDRAALPGTVLREASHEPTNAIGFADRARSMWHGLIGESQRPERLRELTDQIRKTAIAEENAARSRGQVAANDMVIRKLEGDLAGQPVINDLDRLDGYDRAVFNQLLQRRGDLYANGERSALPGTIMRESSHEPTNALMQGQGIRAWHGSPHDPAMEELLRKYGLIQ